MTPKQWMIAAIEHRLTDRLPVTTHQIMPYYLEKYLPILERLVTLGSNAVETFTPAAMGGEVILAEVKRRIGDKVYMIGGFDQNRIFTNCTPDETRAEVRCCFAESGAGGGYILCPSDHFFDGRTDLLKAFAEEARHCLYCNRYPDPIA